MSNLGRVAFMGKDYPISTWSGQQLGVILAVDTETTLVENLDREIPDLVTFQVFNGKEVVFVLGSQVKSFLESHLDSTLILQNFSFDLSVVEKHVGSRCLSFKFIDNGKIKDTSILYRLLHLGTAGFVPPKGYGLDALSLRFLKEELPKDSNIRENFAQFKGKPLEEFPTAFIQYAAKDAIATYFLYFELVALIKPIDKYGALLSHDIQVKGEYALRGITRRGIGVDVEAASSWLRDIDEKMKVQSNVLAMWGWVRGQPGINQRYEDIVKHIGIADYLPRSEKSGCISSKGEDLELYRKYAFVDAYLRFQEMEKAKSFVVGLTEERIHPKYTSIINTGRTSSSKPNIQQIPKVGGIRELFVPKPGSVFIDIDYSTLELCTLAQVEYSMYGTSVMMDLINDGQDLHRYVASKIHGKPMEGLSKEERQIGKPINFGYPGGLGAETFIEFSRGYGFEFSKQEAESMKQFWFEAYPEEKRRMKDIEEGMVYTLTGRARANTSYCAAANTPFQGLAADGAKLALYELEKAGFETVAFIHDQALIECSEGEAEHGMREAERLMIEAMKQVVPDVAITTEGQILERWAK